MKPDRAVPAVVAAVCLGLAACAGTPPPIGQLGAAEQAISGAERAGADHHAPEELRHARITLAAADEAVRNGENAAARRLAEEARAAAVRAAARSFGESRAAARSFGESRAAARSFGESRAAARSFGESQTAAPGGTGSGR